MGYNPGLLDLFVEWAKTHDIKPGAAVLDIGTSELFCAEDPESLNRFLRHFGAPPYLDDELERMAGRGFAAELFGRAGLSYQAVDIMPYPRTLKIDLNNGRLPFWHRRRYALVTNCGAFCCWTRVCTDGQLHVQHPGIPELLFPFTRCSVCRRCFAGHCKVVDYRAINIAELQASYRLGENSLKTGRTFVCLLAHALP